MKYLCLIAAESMLEHMTDADAHRHLDEYRELFADLQHRGAYVACHRLKPPTDAVTVRVRQGDVLATDGPFVETKEQLGGVLLVEARDMNEAIRIAARIPGARLGCVEVRPLADDAPTLAAIAAGDPQ